MQTADEIRRTLEAAGHLMMGGDRLSAADAYLRAAAGYASRGQTAEALAIAFTALQLGPSRFVAVAVSGLVQRLGAQSLPLCKRAVALHLQEQRTHDAATLLELLVQLEPRDAEVRIQLCELYARTGRLYAGLASELVAVDLFEADGNNRDVLAVAQHMLTLDARHLGALRALVRAHQRLGELDRALQHATTLLSINPGDPVALEAMARTLVKRGEVGRGLQVIRHLMDNLAYGDAGALLQRARGWRRDNEDYARALQALRPEEIIELSGDDLLPLTG